MCKQNKCNEEDGLKDECVCEKRFNKIQGIANKKSINKNPLNEVLELISSKK